MTLFTFSLTIAGLIQGNGWLSGKTVYVILPEIHIYNVFRGSAGVMIFCGAVIGLYNMARTMSSGGAERADT